MKSMSHPFTIWVMAKIVHFTQLSTNAGKPFRYLMQAQALMFHLLLH
jgi:hypothetical protein